MLGAGFISGFQGSVDVDLFKPLGGFHDCAEVHVGVAVLGRPHHALWAAGAGEPNIWAGFLHGHNPRIDHPVLVVLSLVPERARLGPAFDDQVVGLFKPFPILGGIDTCL